MSKSACDWVWLRLPLWVGDCDVRSGQSGDEGDLNAADRFTIERHLVDCPTCRQYRASLDQAMGALATTAADLPVDCESPSLWPAIEQRIANHKIRQSSAWIRASARFEDPWNRRSALLALGMSVAASLLVMLIGYPILRRLPVNGQSPTAASATATAVTDRGIPALAPVEEQSGNPEPDAVDDSAANQIAQTEPTRTPETPPQGLDTTIPPKHPVPPPRRFGYDLEHGTPMPPEARDTKPVY